MKPSDSLRSVTGLGRKNLFCFLLILAASRPGISADTRAIERNQQAAALPVFTDVTAAVGFKSAGYPFGNPIWGDYDNDGDLDLFVDNHFNRPPYLYRNEGNGSFTEIFSSTGIDPRGDRHGSSWVDFDNDGDLDLSITKGAAQGSDLGTKEDDLYDNLGADQFVNIAEQSGVINTWGRGRSVAWGDFNHDGNLDLLLGNLMTDLVLYENNGDGTFTDATVSAGLAALHFTETAFADYNNDGFPDIFATSALFPFRPSNDALFKNNGDGTFTDVTEVAGILPLNQGRTIAWGDYDNDGDLDLYITRGTDVAFKPTLYRNNGDETFTEVTDVAGLGTIANNRAAAWGDFDNDGFLDLYLVDSGTDPVGKGANSLYHNNHDGTFTNVAASTGVEDTVVSRGRGAAWADYDGDGFLDLFVTNGEDNTQFPTGPQFLFRNGGNNNHWLTLKLVGTSSNRQALGTRVTIQVGRTIQYQENNGANGHFFSQGAAPLHFGLGRTRMIKKITIQWPNGGTQILTRVAADQEITVTEE